MSDPGGQQDGGVAGGFRIQPGRLLLEICSLTERLDLAECFPRRQPVELELGSGDGSFLCDLAARHPERNFVGVERLNGRLRKLDRKGQRLGLSNLRGVRIEAAYFLQYLVFPATLAAIHVYFPDPWPKIRHRARRLINEAFTGHAAQALAVGGVLHVRTDSADYFAQMRAVFAASPHFTPVDTPPELASLPTDFEREFNARGLPTLRAAFRRVALILPPDPHNYRASVAGDK
ncbi:MAG: tRNA (guanosine(46)-N7)-methyltransferase TrmB [Verrucomicrobiae bacterium]|nr:tRNA (guanosine(46)-N7)-methyltransferase TrmB [Verrucomicrobiae bacterium]